MENSSGGKMRFDFRSPYNKQAENKSKKEQAELALFEAMQLGKNQEWDNLIETGIAYPALMDRLCSSFYRLLPDKYKYVLPVKWYILGGKCADSVLHAMRKARKYRPEKWTGREQLKKQTGFDVFIGSRCGIDEAKKEIAWTTSYESAFVHAQLISGRVYRGYINADDIIAIDKDSVEGILQYDSVIGVEQIYPKMPVSLI